MRSIVAMGVATFVACCLVTASWAEETTPCEKGGKCCAAKVAAGCPACSAAKTTVTTEACCEKSCKSCAAATAVVATAAGETACCQGQCAAAKCTECTGECSKCAPTELSEIKASPIALASSVSSPAGAIQAVANLKEGNGAPRRYTVKVQMMGNSGKQELAAPTINVAEGTTASVGSHMSRPFVTGLRKNPEGMAQPIITVLDEGTTIEVRVTPLANRRVQLDATIEQSTIDSEEEVESPFQTEEERETLQAPEVSSQSRRVVRAVQLGDTVKIRCGCACGPNGEQGTVVLLTVDQVDAPTPGITPITKVTATEDVKGDELYLIVYPVGDLLEPYAVHKEGEAVEAADFLPIIDMLLTEVGCDWPAEAEIRPFEANQSVVVSQTQQGHEAIARYLARKRACIAEIEANLLWK